MHYATSRKVVVSIRDKVIDFFFNWPHHSSLTMALRSTLPLTEMSVRNLRGGGGGGGQKGTQPACKVDNLTAICEPIV
jgi:hypothetical protein